MDQKSLDPTDNLSVEPHRYLKVADCFNFVTAVPMPGYVARRCFRPCNFIKGEEE